MIWGCFIKAGISFTFCEGRINQATYKVILEENLLSSAPILFPNCQVNQGVDGGPHRSCKTLSWPTQSPDLSPNENHWNQEFWNTYPHNGKGGGSGSSPTVDIAGMVAGIVAGLVLLVMAAAVIMYCVRYRAKERRRGRAPVNLTSLAPPSEDLPLTQLPVLEVTAPGLPSYEEALEASGTYDAPPPPYQ
ncbi:transmembrane gamma-carboxyglutamic acid protein 2-like, partial [Bombina bombina]|uniref:transmembrane gamma-carboxyglutamic acid protein 2-like n=1 Tax=Bombina bombina TaxID=8345 RepID=UPI00235B182D